jgi:hypothetical protein
MTNFILPDGTIVDVGQEWAIDMTGGPMVCVIQELFSMKEMMILGFPVNVISSLTLGEPVKERVTWDLHWSTFVYGYEQGTICRHAVGEPTKRIPPMNFI